MTGVVKNIIPAITSINAIVAACSVNEALKLATNCYKRMDSFMMYNGKVCLRCIISVAVDEDLPLTLQCLSGWCLLLHI